MSTLRREFQRVGGQALSQNLRIPEQTPWKISEIAAPSVAQVTFVDDHDPKKAYRKWQELHHEA